MDKINSKQVNNTSFSSAKPKIKEVKNMEEHIQKMVKELFRRAEREVPEYGDFKIVYEEFKNPDKTLCATDFLLKIVKPPKNIEGHEKIRNLELVAYKLPSPYMAERLVASGTKDEILKQLQDDSIYKKLEEATKSLSHNLEDM